MEERINANFSREMKNLSLKNSEQNFSKRHNRWVNKKIDERRQNIIDNLNTSDSDINIPDNSINITDINQCLNFFNQSVDNNNLVKDKNKTKSVLKILRRELCKDDFINADILNVILSNQMLCKSIAELLFDFKNSEIQLEILWILNNLCIYCYKFNFQSQFFEIHQLLIKFMHSESNFSNMGVRSLILQKFFSLIGNLILYEENVLNIYLSNNILIYLMKNLNSSVRSLRSVCLWTINNIIKAVNKCVNSISIDDSNNNNNCSIINTITNTNSLINQTLYNNKDFVYYIKFLFSRIEPYKNFDESYEFLYLLSYSSNSEMTMSTLLSNEDYLQKLLNLAVIDKLHQPAIRVLGNLISILISGNISSSLNILISNEKSFICFIQNYINLNNKYLLTSQNDYYLFNDIIWFLNNLSCIDVKLVENNFYSHLITLLEAFTQYGGSNSQGKMFLSYLDTKEIVKNILITLYRINSQNDIGVSESKVISILISNIGYFNYDLVLRYIVIDFIMFHVGWIINNLNNDEGSKVKIDEEVLNKIESARVGQCDFSEDDYTFITTRIMMVLESINFKANC